MSTAGPVLFIGVGAMGAPMAASLRRGGIDVSVADADDERASEVAHDLGARAVPRARLKDAAAAATTVIVMVPDSRAVESVLVHDDRLFSALRQGTLVIDMSSSSPSSTVGLGETANRHGVRFVDAPVSGGVPKARSGELAIMVGGSASDVSYAHDLLALMGKSITHVGPLGSGHAMKALNNLLSAIGMVAAAEVVAIATKFGISSQVAVDVLNSSTGRNYATEAKMKPYVLSRSFDSGFALRLMVKDLRTALDLAHETGTPVPISASCLEEWSAAALARGPAADHTEIAAYVEARTGVVLE